MDIQKEDDPLNRRGASDFSVPENYFDQFSNRLSKRLTKPDRFNVFQLLKRPQWVIAYSFILIALVVIIVIQYNSRNNTKEIVVLTNKVDSIQKKETEERENIKSVDTQIVNKEAIHQEVVKDTNVVILDENIPEIAFNSPQELDILLDEGIDEDLIIEALLD